MSFGYTGTHYYRNITIDPNLSDIEYSKFEQLYAALLPPP